MKKSQASKAKKPAKKKPSVRRLVVKSGIRAGATASVANA